MGGEAVGLGGVGSVPLYTVCSLFFKRWSFFLRISKTLALSAWRRRMLSMHTNSPAGQGAIGAACFTESLPA